jgi:hypothetical protein
MGQVILFSARRIFKFATEGKDPDGQDALNDNE